MLLDDDFVKFSLNDKLYTLQLTDNPEMKLKIKKGRNTYYVATKDEMIAGLTSTQEYIEIVKIFYYIDGELIQLGVKENISELKVETIDYTIDDFVITDKIKVSKVGSFIRENNIGLNVFILDYNKYCLDDFSTEYIEPKESGMAPSVTDKIVSIERDIININDSTMFNLENISIDRYGGKISASVTADVIRTIIDYNTVDNFGINNTMVFNKQYIGIYNNLTTVERSIINYNNLDNFTGIEVSIVNSQYTGIQEYTQTIERITMNYNGTDNYTLSDAIMYGSDSIGIEWVKVEEEVTTGD